MKRKLLILDAALVMVVAFAAVQLRNEWRAAKAREAATLHKPIKPAKVPAFTPLPPEPPVLATGYAKIAENMLFDKSRNPTVVIEQPAPPPKPPMPPLPVFHGIMNIGSEGPTAILSVNANSPHTAVHPGETIGQFKLLDVNTDELVLEWEGETVRKKVGDLAAAMTAPPPAAEVPSRTDVPAAPAAPPPPVMSGPGDLTQFGNKMCVVNDGNSEGAVKDGYKKVMHATPFGQSCTWEPVGK